MDISGHRILRSLSDPGIELKLHSISMSTRQPYANAGPCVLGDNRQVRLMQLSSPPLEIIKLILWLIHQSVS